MTGLLSVENMRRSDAAAIAAGTPGRELMLRAGRAVFERVDWRPPVAVLCGSGNNAGDGYVVAYLLHEAGIPCTVFLLSDRFSEDGRFYFDRCREAGVPVRTWDASVSLSDFATVADCIFGTGFRGTVQGTVR